MHNSNPASRGQDMEDNLEDLHAKTCKSAIQKLRKKTLLIKNQQKRTLRERTTTKYSTENKFKNFMKKWSEHKKSRFKTLIPAPLFKAIGSSELIDLNLLQQLEISPSEEDHLKVQKALKFYKDQLKGLGVVGEGLIAKFHEGLNEVSSTMNSFECPHKHPSNDQFLSGLNLFEESDANQLEKSNSFCQSPREHFEKL